MQENKLTQMRYIRDVMSRHDKRFAKSLGQNFLTDPQVLQAIVRGSGIDRSTQVLEVGPGIGVLTFDLACAADKVVAVEIDAKLLPILHETLAEFDNVTVVHDDIMQVDLRGLLREHFTQEKIKVAANLPYYITSPILMRLMEYKEHFSTITVMVQKEVAQRMAAKEGSKAWSSFSIALQYYGDVEILAQVPKESFVPSPKVDSAVVKITLRDSQKYFPKDEKLFFQVVRASFAQRRKTLANALSASNLGIPKEVLISIFEKLDLGANVRGEQLSIEMFCKLSDEILQIKQTNNNMGNE